MIQYKKIKKEVQELVDVKCDVCLESCKTEYGYEFVHLKSDWGFGSSLDGQTWTAHVCEKCTKKKLKFIKFKKETTALL